MNHQYGQSFEKDIQDFSQQPPTKKVRFSGVMLTEQVSADRATRASSPGAIELLMEKVRRRAERRKRRSMSSPPPPPPQDEIPSKPDEPELSTAAVMKRKLDRMERDIKESARLELHLMNQSKKLRDRRAILTRKYESMAHQLQEIQRASQPQGEIFQMGCLPPLMSKMRRVSSTKPDEASHLGV